WRKETWKGRRKRPRPKVRGRRCDPGRPTGRCANARPLSRHRRVLGLSSAAQAANELADTLEPVFPQVVCDSLVYLLADERIVEQRRPDADRGRACNEELH